MTRKIASALFALSLFAVANPGEADNQGYFLSWQQKKELLCLGRIQDGTGIWYDIWICPGYHPPAHYAKEHLKQAGADFYEYFERNKYHSLKEGSKACFDWALKTCGLEFTVKGIPQAWGNYFSVAHDRTQRRVFGWWMAYPWALLESTVETAFRGALGGVGTVGGLASGVAIVPAYHALDSAIAGVWELGVNTIIIPTVGVTWNTVIGPPLALVGQKPAQSRVDGFWVTMVDSGRERSVHQLTPAELQLLSEWGLLLLKETKPLNEKRIEISKDADERTKRLYHEIQQVRTETGQKRAALRTEEHAFIQQLAATNELSSALLSQHSELVHSWDYADQLRHYLANQKLSATDITRILSLLKAYSSPRAGLPSRTRGKTDPLLRSVDVIGEAIEDTLK